MLPEQRTILYAELARYDINEFHKDPVFISSGNVDDWFGDSSVRPES